MQRTTVKSAPQKPATLPIGSLQALEALDAMSEEDYLHAVNYFLDIGGFNAKEATYQCFKEAIQDDITLSLTWFGGKGKMSLHDMILTRVIYDAVSCNEYVDKMTRCDFESHMKAALKAAQERANSRVRKCRIQDLDS